MNFNEIRLADITNDSISDGLGVRTVIWTQGCTHNCYNCHNAQTHDLNGGYLYNIDKLVSDILENSFQKKITFSGGDPFLQPFQCYKIAHKLKKYDFNIWCYTGFLYEQLILNKNTNIFLEQIDVLIDGKYEDDLKDYTLRFKGSSNQRIIDVQKSLKEKEIILLKMA